MPANTLEALFPNLTTVGYEITSPTDGRYNCIAWAAGDTSRWWWPVEGGGGGHYWPPGATVAETLLAFQEAYATLGYSPCASGDPEDGVEKIAIFVDSTGAPTHAARQLADGRWASKLGRLEDIEHFAVDGVSGSSYGSVGAFMAR